MIVKFYTKYYGNEKLLFVSKDYESISEELVVRKAVKALKKHCHDNYIECKPDAAVFVQDGIEVKISCLYECDIVMVDNEEVEIDPRLIINWKRYPLDIFVD
jgi:tRNA A37 threonylcarbamoyladenosine dehydratase